MEADTDQDISYIVAKTMWALGQTRDVAEVEHLFNCEINHDRSPFE